MAEKFGQATDFDVELHSVYSAYLGFFETNCIDWWDKSWGGYFMTFNDFLSFGWEVMTVVDSRTGRSHIAVRRDQIGLFAKMIRTRFGEVLPKDPPTTLPLSPVNTKHLSLRRLVTISDLASYRKLAQTLPAAELNYVRTRVRAGEPDVVSQLFYCGAPVEGGFAKVSGLRDNGVGYTWACVRTTWWERGGPPYGVIPGHGRTQPKPAPGQAAKGLPLEVGMAVLRCANLNGVGVWPPVPSDNYRKSHYIAEEWVDKRVNASPPSYPRNYAFGKSRFIAEKDVEKILEANLSSIASQENESQPNTLVLLHAGEPEPLPVPASSALPMNVLNVNVLALEWNMRRQAQNQGLPNAGGHREVLPNLAALLQLLQIPVSSSAPLGNAGNEAFYTLLAFQKLVMAETRLPDLLFNLGGAFMTVGMPTYYPTMPMGPSPYVPQPQTFPIPPYSPLIPPQFPQSSRRSSFASAPASPAHSLAARSPRERPTSFAYDRSSSMVDVSAAASGSSPAPSGTPRPNVPQRRPMPRSKTVFWDDSDFADAEVKAVAEGGQRDRPRTDTELPRRRGQSSEPKGTADGRARMSVTLPRSGRTSHWEHMEQIEDPPISRLDRSVGAGTGGSGVDTDATPKSARRVSWEHSKTFSAYPQPNRQERPRPDKHPSKETSQGSSTQAGSSAASGSESSLDKKPPLQTPSQPTLQKKGSKAKLKSEKNVKNLAGAFARFWTE